MWRHLLFIIIILKSYWYIGNSELLSYSLQINCLIFEIFYFNFIISQFCSLIWKMNGKLWILDVFVTRFSDTLKNFPGYWTNSFTVAALNFYRKGYIKIVRELWKINTATDNLLDNLFVYIYMYVRSDFFNLLIFRYYYYETIFRNILNTVDFFQFLVDIIPNFHRMSILAGNGLHITRVPSTLGAATCSPWGFSYYLFLNTNFYLYSQFHKIYYIYLSSREVRKRKLINWRCRENLQHHKSIQGIQKRKEKLIRNVAMIIKFFLH